MGCNPGKLNCMSTGDHGDNKSQNEETVRYERNINLKEKPSLSRLHYAKTITLYNASKPDNQPINKSTLEDIVQSFPFPVQHSDHKSDVTDDNNVTRSSVKTSDIKIIRKFDWSASFTDGRQAENRRSLKGKFQRPSIFRREKHKSSPVKKSAFQLMVMKSVETVVPMVVPLEQWLQQRLSSWVQLSGHKGTIIPASEKTLWKKCGKVGDNFEAQAYCKLMNDICQPLVPRFYKEVEYCGETFIEIEDLTRMFDNPAIMDIKLGTRTFLESEVTNSKKRPDLFKKMIQLDPTEPTLEENEERAITKLRYMQERYLGELRKDFKRLKDIQELSVVLMQFLNVEESFTFLARTIERLKEIRTFVEKSSFFASHEVIGSSLLILYDDQSLNIFLIDFAKAIPLDTCGIKVDHRSRWTLGNKEDGYLTGLDNLIEILESRPTE